MTPQELKNSILQLAIQGKLVEQRPEEGTAEELYRQIQQEKQRLMKEGKTKKEKPLPEITEEEKPFDIPESWKWVHLNQIAESGLGKTLDKAKNTGDLCPYLCSINVYWEGISLDKIKEAKFTPEDKEKYRLHNGDLLICEGGDVGRSAIWNADIEMYYQNALHRVRFYGDLSPYYFKHLIECYKGIGIIDKYSKGMTIKHLVQGSLYDMWLPLPPLAEQKRIVAKIEELLPLIDRYEKAWSRLEEFNKRFPDDMQKSILQMAIQGKLVEQRPEEGTGEELYQQIQAEKQKLIKEGKIKKEKPLPEIMEEEKPFDIPGSWKWVHLGDIASFENGDRSDKYPIEADYVDFGVPFFGAKDIEDKYLSFKNVRYISEKKFAELGNGKLKDKDFICLLRGSVGRCAIFRIDNMHKTGFICAQMIIIRCLFTNTCNYIDYYLSSPLYKALITKRVTGTAVRQLAGKELSNFVIPLPPLAEQKRIVARLEELSPICERLKR